MTGRLVEPAAGPRPDRADGCAAPGRRLDPADLEAAVAAVAAPRAGGRIAADDEVAAAVAETLCAVRSFDTAETRHPVDWSTFGVLIPVLAGSPGAGASTGAAATVDAAQLAGRCALLVDAADPARSGLATAAPAEGPWTAPVTPLLQIRYSWRRQALVARLESRLPVISPGMVPPPRFWRPAVDPLHVTVVDVGHDGWRAAANPLLGAGAWLRRGIPATRPVLVVRPSRPSLRHTEQVLARLDPWVRSGAVSPPCQLVVVGAKRWPRGVVGAAGRRVEPLLRDAIFVPHDGAVAAGGVVDEPLGARVRRPLARLLVRSGVLPPDGRGRAHQRALDEGVA